MSDCIFCKIPSNKVYEDDKMIAFKDLEPAAPVHVLLVPKTHADNVMKAEPALVGYMLGKVAEIAEKLGIKEDGFRLIINTGKDGGQTVQHLHIHLIGGKAGGQTVQHLHIHLIGGKAMGWPPFPKES